MARIHALDLSSSSRRQRLASRSWRAAEIRARSLLLVGRRQVGDQLAEESVGAAGDKLVIGKQGLHLAERHAAAVVGGQIDDEADLRTRSCGWR